MLTNNYTQISGNQLVLLLITLVGSTAIIYSPAMSIKEAGQDAWLSILIPATLYGLVVVWVTTKLAGEFSDLTFREYTEVLIGKWMARLVNLLYFLYTLSLLIVIIREFGNVLSTAFMPETPIVVFNLAIILLSVYATWGGIEVICRMNQFHLPILFTTVVLLFMFLLKDVELSRLLPVLEEGVQPVLVGALVPSAFRGEVFILMWLVFHLKKPGDSTKLGVLAVIIIGVLLTIDAISILTILGKELASREVFASLSVARYINVGHFMNRVEGLAMIVWVASVITKTSALFYIVLETAKATFGVKNSNWYLVLIIGILLFIGAGYTFENDLQVVWYLEHIFPPTSYLFQLFIPFLLLCIAWVKRKGVSPYG